MVTLSATVTVLVVNTGNVDSTAPLTVSVGLNTDGSTTATVPAAAAAAHRLRVRANNRPVKLKVSFTVPTGLAGTYFPVVMVAGTVATPATSAVSAVGPSFTVAG